MVKHQAGIEVAGFAAIFAGIAEIHLPSALIVAGLATVFAAQAPRGVRSSGNDHTAPGASGAGFEILRRRWLSFKSQVAR